MRDLTLQFRGFKLVFSWDGPDGNKAQQRVRRDTARTICGPSVLNTVALDDAIDARDTQLAVLYVGDHEDNDYDALPPRLQQLLYSGRKPRSERLPSVLTGFYLFSVAQPCILSYLCLKPEARRAGLGDWAYKSYEVWVRTVYVRPPPLSTPRCRRIMLASLDEQNVIDFYRRQGFRMPDSGPVRGPTRVDFTDEYGYRVAIDVPPTTVLMIKTFDDETPLLPRDSSDSSDDESDVILIRPAGDAEIGGADDDDRLQALNASMQL